MQSNHPVLSFQSIILFQNKFNAHTQILYWFQLICHTYKVFHSLTKTWFFSPPMQSAVQKVSNIQRGPGEDYINLGFIAEQMSLKWANITHRVHFVSWKRLALAYQYEENKPSPPPPQMSSVLAFLMKRLKRGTQSELQIIHTVQLNIGDHSNMSTFFSSKPFWTQLLLFVFVGSNWLTANVLSMGPLI